MSKPLVACDRVFDYSSIVLLELYILPVRVYLPKWDAPEGLAIAQTQQLDAILLDVMMPDMDGLTLLGTLQNDSATQAIPVILLTAKVQSADFAQFANLGVAGVIAKPFDPLTLAEQVASTLGW